IPFFMYLKLTLRFINDILNITKIKKEVLKMLKDMKLSTDVTLMIEMYKLHNTELEDIEVIRKEETDYANMSIPYVETSRLKPLDNKILKEYADVDYHDVISKEINKITNQDRKSTRLNSSHVSISYA